MNKTELIDKLLHLGNTTEMCSSTDRHNAKELAHTLIDEYLKAINHSQCCKSDSEQLFCGHCGSKKQLKVETDLSSDRVCKSQLCTTEYSYA